MESTAEVDTLAKPILRWAGGKSHLLSKINELLPPRWNRYAEPLLGGGAIFFALAPKQSVLCDTNSELINFYRTLRDSPKPLIETLMELRASTERYYELRDERPKRALERAIRFAYLNRLCWNGLYRVNRNGHFNVPIGGRLPSKLWNEAHLWKASESLQGAKLLSSDFSYLLRNLKRGDFTFIDPPYPRGAKEGIGFNRYTQNRFSLGSHRRLARWLTELDRRGVRFIVTLSGIMNSIYPSKFERHFVTTSSLISCNGSSRGEVQEIILRNYK